VTLPNFGFAKPVLASPVGPVRSGRSKLLKVPYFTQPTHNTCQSTVLKMFASYLEREVLKQENGAIDLNPTDIYKTINASAERPVKQTNSHANIKWWLEQRFPTIKFKYVTTTTDTTAIELIVGFVDRGFPVLVSVSHAKVKGHIVLVIGYEGYVEQASSPAFKLVVHDPYGAFDPTLLSADWGKQRYTGGLSLQAGGEIGPGTAVRLDPHAASRQRKGDSQKGTFYLLSVG
jgi:hypothetical protein